MDDVVKYLITHLIHCYSFGGSSLGLPCLMLLGEEESVSSELKVGKRVLKNRTVRRNPIEIGVTGKSNISHLQKLLQ